MLKNMFKLISVLFILESFGLAQNLDEIISNYNANISKAKKLISDLEVTQRITLETEGMVFEEKAIIYYKDGKRAKKTLEVKGKKMPEKIPEFDWLLGYSISQKDYNFSLAGDEKVGEEECFKIALKPTKEDEKLINGFIWISKEDYGIVKLENSPLKNPRMVKKSHIIHIYSKSKEGIRFLQKRIVKSVVNAIVKDVESLNIFEYTDYKINTGLKDELFK
jgi:outer membrane lipoprotein-sorting protein